MNNIPNFSEFETNEALGFADHLKELSPKAKKLYKLIFATNFGEFWDSEWNNWITNDNLPAEDEAELWNMVKTKLEYIAKQL